MLRNSKAQFFCVTGQTGICGILQMTESKTKSSIDFGTGRMLPLMLKMAAPSIAAQVVNMLYGIVDRIYIGHIPGTGTMALAGVGVCTTIITLISSFAQFTGGGGAPLTAIALGRGDEERAEKLLGNGITLLLVLGVALMTLTALFMDPLLRLTGASDTTLPYAHSYLSIYLTGTLFVMVTIGLNPFLNVMGHPAIAMFSVLIGAALNIALDPLFIFTFGMGVAGAALATVISQGVSAVWIIRFLLPDKAAIHVTRADLKPDAGVLCKILALGVSPFVMGSTEGIIGLVMNSGLSRYGDIYVSTLTVMQSCMMIYSVPLAGFSSGVSPVISWNYGHGNTERVKEGFRILFVVATGCNLVMDLWMILMPGLFARIFTSDAELIGKVSEIMPVFLIGMCIFGMQRACQNMFVALDEPKVSLFIALLRKIFLLVPLALVLPRFMGVMGIYAAEPIADGTAAICCVLIFVHHYRHILFGPGAAEQQAKHVRPEETAKPEQGAPES